jgi:hypothetical protein
MAVRRKKSQPKKPSKKAATKWADAFSEWEPGSLNDQAWRDAGGLLYDDEKPQSLAPVQAIVTIHFDTDLTLWQAFKFRLAGGRYWKDHVKEIVERQIQEEVRDHR